MTIAVGIRGVHKTFAGGAGTVFALNGIDLEVATGEFIAITGPSGSGKSTLLQLVGGLDSPTAGEVILGSTHLEKLRPRELARIRNKAVGFIFQNFNLLPSLTVAENVGLPAVIDGRDARDWQPRVRQLLEMVGLSTVQDRYPANLSGGEQQRVAVARAMVMRPQIVLADEPTGNLDSTTGESVVRLIHSCHREGATVMLVTHDLKLASRAQRIVTLRDGLVADDATVEPEPLAVRSNVLRLGEEPEG